jgi:TetR/AcrR family transcriptional repressor of nem operon
MSEVRQAEDTRTRILETALDLFHRGSFKGTSINQVVEQAGITKGALFHYFKGKNELGYAVVDERIRQHIVETWVEPLATSVDPVSDILSILDHFQEMMEEMPQIMESGCPLNNLAQEMSAQDETFRLKLLELYRLWQTALEKALRAGIDAGNVKKEVDPKSTAAAIVALLEGSIGMVKVNRDMVHLVRMDRGLRIFFNLLRP